MTHQTEVDLPLEFMSKGREALVAFWWTAALLRKVARRFFREHGSSEGRFNLMIALRNSANPMTQNDLSDKLLVDKSNVTGLIDRLEEEGLIRRNKVPDDRRSYHITLTDMGSEQVHTLESQYATVVQRVMADFTREEAAELSRLLRKVREELAKEDI